MAGNFTSSSIPLSYNIGYAVQLNWTGSPVGQSKLQSSIDNINFADIPNSTLTVSGSPPNITNVRIASYPFVRLVYTFTSGTGTAEVLFSSN